MNILSDKIKQIRSLFQFDAFHKWWRDLKECLANKKHYEVMCMLRNVKAVKSCDRKGNSVLHYVARADSQEIARKLLASGYDVNHKNHAGVPPIAVAVAFNSLNVTKLFIEHGAATDAGNFVHDFGLLHIAVLSRSHEVAKLLVNAGLDVNARDEDSRTPLQLAVAYHIFGRRPRSLALIKMLINAGAHVNVCTKERTMIPLHDACSQGHLELVNLLLKAGADVNMEDGNNSTSLIWAVKSRNVALVKLLLDEGSDINHVDKFGNTCLHYASGILSPKIMQLLLENGANANVHNEESFTPLLYVIHQCLEESMFDMPVELDYDDYIKKHHSEMKLNDQFRCIKMLLKNGADIDFWIDNDWHPPMHPPIYESFNCAHSQITRLLLSFNPVFDYAKIAGAFTIVLPNRKKSLHELMTHTALCIARDGQNSRILNFKEEILRKDLQQDYARCRNELEQMKNTLVAGTRVSYFNLLIDRDIKRFTCNENMIKAIESTPFIKKFPIYCDMLAKRFSKAAKRQRLIESAMSNLGKAVGLDVHSFAQIFDNISMYLDKKDLISMSKVYSKNLGLISVDAQYKIL